MQAYGDPIIPGHKEEYVPLNDEDRERIQKEIEKLFLEEEFSDENWHLTEISR